MWKERGIVLECINCGQPCVSNQLNCANCQRNLHNEQGEESSLIDKELEVYVGRQYPYYKRKWDLENKRIARWSWNGWATIFNVGWLGYRKYYLPAALFILLLVACDAFSYYMGFNVALPIINMVPLTFLLLVFILFGMGIFANGLYYQFAERRIYRIKARGIKDESVENYLIRDSGGTSRMGATIVTILAVASIFSVISFFRPIEILYKKYVQARFMNIRSFRLVNRLKTIFKIQGGYIIADRKVWI